MNEPDNRLIPEYPDPVEPCPRVEDPSRLRESFQQYLRDESRLESPPVRALWFPRTTAEVSAAVREIRARGEKLTISGARTGIVGGAVPVGSENILSLERLAVEAEPSWHSGKGMWTLRAGAGLNHQGLLDILSRGGSPASPPLLYPVDPTELSASLGGNAATNASGARTLHFGPTRDWLEEITVVLADGGVLRLGRGRQAAREGRFVLERPGEAPRICTFAPVNFPATKHVGGYPLASGMDLMDLFIGAEGTLGIITEMELRLCRQEGERLYTCLFLPDGVDPPRLVREIKGSAELVPLAIEYMDDRSLDLLRGYREETGQASGVPALPAAARGVLYLELAYAGEAALDPLAAALDRVLRPHGVSLDESWAGFTREDLEAMKRFRHALPERINSIIGQRKSAIPGLTKVGTDMAVPDSALPEMMAVYRSALAGAGLEYAVFGHIGNGHLHVNILPRTLAELEAARRLYGDFARQAVRMGGSVAAEHGIGRLKKAFLQLQFGEREIHSMRTVRDFLDPEGRLNPGVLF